VNAAWATAFVALSVLVLVLGVLVIGLMRRVAPVLDRLEAADLSGPEVVREGLDPGIRIRAFEAVTATGQLVTRETIKAPAGRSLVVFLEPGCGYCETIMAELLESPWRSDLPPLYLALTDSADARERQLEKTCCTVLYQHDSAVSDAFGTNVTPVAFVLDSDGIVVAKQVPRQANDVVALAHIRSRQLTQLPMLTFDGH